MKVFYTLVLLSGLYLFVTTQWAGGNHPPRDFVVALTLSRHPDEWSVSMNNEVQKSLLKYDVKKEMTAALHRRVFLGSQIRAYTVWFGLGLMALSIVGLRRERKIHQLAKLVEPQDAAPIVDPIAQGP
jgi:hypothetical protein